MGHIIENAKSGRSKCRTCKAKIEKDTIRFGEEVANEFASDGYETTYKYHHLKCAAKSKPIELDSVINGTKEKIPNKEELLKLIADSKKKIKPSNYPYAELSPSGRAKCIHCGEPIPKDEVRVVIEQEIDTGSFTKMGPAYIHAFCANKVVEDDNLIETLKTNSTTLSEDDVKDMIQILET